MAINSRSLKNSPKSVFSGQTIPDTYQNIEGLKNSTSYASNNDGAILAGSTLGTIPNTTTTTTTTSTTTTTTTIA
jgi:hypothetical protein